MKFYVYILYSYSLKRHYIGQTQDLNLRLERHNKGLVKSTKPGIPWALKASTTVESRKEAMKLERKLKNFKSNVRLEKWIEKVVGSEK